MERKQRAFRVFKYTVYSLLFLNIFLLLKFMPAPHKALDQVGWLLILSVFEWDTRALAAGRPLRIGGVPLMVELTGYAFAVYALAHYTADAEWLDVVNAVTWLAISAMIWLDILVPVVAGTLAQRRRGLVKALLYTLVFACAVAWGVTGRALDFYDAALWILCFFVIEMNILAFEQRPRRVPVTTLEA